MRPEKQIILVYWTGRRLASEWAMRAPVQALTIALMAAIGLAAPAGAEPAELAAIGAPKAPAYVYADKLEHIEPMRFRRPTNIQVARPGTNQTLRLRPSVRYLWIIDKSNAIRIAPETRDARNVETSEHPLLTAKGPAQIGGVMIMRNSVLTVNSDSKRFGYLDSSIKKNNLETATRQIKRIAITDRAGRRPHLQTRYVPSIHDKQERNPLDNADLRLARFVEHHGDYVLLPPRGKSTSDLPARLRSTNERLQWSRQARQH